MREELADFYAGLRHGSLVRRWCFCFAGPSFKLECENHGSNRRIILRDTGYKTSKTGSTRVSPLSMNERDQLVRSQSQAPEMKHRTLVGSKIRREYNVGVDE
jgi:hypothetical protein